MQLCIIGHQDGVVRGEGQLFLHRLIEKIVNALPRRTALDRLAENGGELFRPRAVQVVRVGEVLDLQIDLALQLVQREIPVFQPVMRGAEVPQRIDVGLIVFGVVQVAAGQRGP